ncbi:hypothetical protein [Actinoplanes sp. DH11]|uniref:hypothetical protein n=1 Tax=Actinoplanes sp. DH11 TaxID=2857011 RepID=UPI001E32657A|nr:hypothetical protein [Actinoplanes sp. DH11]
MRVEVDGEVFEVVAGEDDNPGAYHYNWISGRDPDYGFTSAFSDRRTPTMREHEDAIRDFLSKVDPETGYW